MQRSNRLHSHQCFFSGHTSPSQSPFSKFQNGQKKSLCTLYTFKGEKVSHDEPKQANRPFCSCFLGFNNSFLWLHSSGIVAAWSAIQIFPQIVAESYDQKLQFSRKSVSPTHKIPCTNAIFGRDIRKRLENCVLRCRCCCSGGCNDLRISRAC